VVCAGGGYERRAPVDTHAQVVTTSTKQLVFGVVLLLMLIKTDLCDLVLARLRTYISLNCSQLLPRYGSRRQRARLLACLQIQAGGSLQAAIILLTYLPTYPADTSRRLSSSCCATCACHRAGSCSRGKGGPPPPRTGTAGRAQQRRQRGGRLRRAQRKCKHSSRARRVRRACRARRGGRKARTSRRRRRRCAPKRASSSARSAASRSVQRHCQQCR
jgi:hypothetical protein